MKSKHPMFNTVAIETFSKCDNRCPFCPVCYHPRPDHYMEDKTIISIIEQLKELKYKGHIHWHFFNEPLLNKNLEKWVKLAAEKIPYSYQVVSTNGNNLTDARIKSLHEAGLNAIVINQYNSKTYKIPTKYKKIGAWDRNKGLVKGVRPFNISLLDKRFYFKKEVCKDRKYRLCNRGGNIPKFLPALKEPLQKKCVRPFRQLIINAWSDVVVCCQDYNASVKFGNIKKQTLWDVWTSKLANHYRARLANADRASLKFCNKCDFDGGAFQMNLKYIKEK